jgi:hypothetical protein
MATTDIDAAGDVVVQIGEERIRISSKVMSLASPVFKGMFRSGFKEGLTPQSTASNPSIISLPDDDPTAFIYLSRAIHFQGCELPKHVNIAFFEKLASMYDKYQCTAPIASYVQAPLEKLAASASTRDLGKILFVAYILDAPHLFSSASWKMVIAQEQPWQAIPDAMNHPSISVFLLSK